MRQIRQYFLHGKNASWGTHKKQQFFSIKISRDKHVLLKNSLVIFNNGNTDMFNFLY